MTQRLGYPARARGCWYYWPSWVSPQQGSSCPVLLETELVSEAKEKHYSLTKEWRGRTSLAGAQALPISCGHSCLIRSRPCGGKTGRAELFQCQTKVSPHLVSGVHLELQDHAQLCFCTPSAKQRCWVHPFFIWNSGLRIQVNWNSKYWWGFCTQHPMSKWN